MEKEFNKWKSATAFGPQVDFWAEKDLTEEGSEDSEGKGWGCVKMGQ